MIETSTNHGPISGLVVIPRTPRKIRLGHYYRYSGICSDVRFGAHSNTLLNIQRAVAERVLKVPDGLGGLKACLKPLSRGYFINTMRSCTCLIGLFVLLHYRVEMFGIAFLIGW